VTGLAGRRVLVTGHTGFKGSWLCLALARAGAAVTGLALDPPTTPALYSRAGVADLLVADVRADIRDRDALADTVASARPDLVVHLAAQPLVRRSYADPAETFDVNVGGTVALLDTLRREQRRSGRRYAVVVVTSDKCYAGNAGTAGGCAEDDPLGGHDPYSASKAAAEMVAASYRASFPEAFALATARAGNVIGGGDWAEDRLMPDAIRALRGGSPIEVRSPASVRPWQHVLEPVAGYLTLGRRLLSGDPAACTAFNFGPGDDAAVPVSHIVETVVADWGSGSWRALPDPEGPFEQPTLTLNSARARRTLGWQPVWSLEEALHRTVAWYRGETSLSSAAVLALCHADLAAHGRRTTTLPRPRPTSEARAAALS
jgi:CDP-glucose 4,6-dehydratase